MKDPEKETDIQDEDKTMDVKVVLRFINETKPLYTTDRCTGSGATPIDDVPRHKIVRKEVNPN